MWMRLYKVLLTLCNGGKGTEKVPGWASTCRRVLLCQPSSACVERVFSLLIQFNDQQQSALEDYVESALIMRYNFDK